MTPANISYVIGLFVIFFCTDTAHSIRCFQCSSYENPKCADLHANDTDSPFLHKCEPRDGHQMFCRKVVQKVVDDPNFKRITRTCGWYLYKSNTSNCQVTDTDFKKETTCQCFTDACNVGTVLTPVFSSVVTLLGVILGLLFAMS